MAPQVPTALQFEGQGAKNSKRSSSHLIFSAERCVSLWRHLFERNLKNKEENQPSSATYYACIIFQVQIFTENSLLNLSLCFTFGARQTDKIFEIKA